MFTKFDESDEYSNDFVKYNHWFSIEIVVTLAGLSGVVLFTFVRSIIKQHGMHLRSFVLDQADFLDAHINVTGMIVTMIVPFFTVNFIKNRLYSNYPDDPGIKAVDFQHLQTLVQVIIAFILTFVGYTKSP